MQSVSCVGLFMIMILVQISRHFSWNNVYIKELEVFSTLNLVHIISFRHDLPLSLHIYVKKQQVNVKVVCVIRLALHGTPDVWKQFSIFRQWGQSKEHVNSEVMLMITWCYHHFLLCASVHILRFFCWLDSRGYSPQSWRTILTEKGFQCISLIPINVVSMSTASVKLQCLTIEVFRLRFYPDRLHR